MNQNISTIGKIALLPNILSAAQLLYELGLSKEIPTEVVRKYVLANPDINQLMQRQMPR
jgi:hypothetical protein